MRLDASTVSSLYARLLAHGYAPDEEAQRLARAIDDVRDPEVLVAEARKRFEDAVLAGDDKARKAAQDDLTDAESQAASWASRNAMRDDLARRLAVTIGDSAFAFVRALYDSTGAQMNAAVKGCDPLAEPDAVLLSDDDEARRAYASLPVLADKLDDLSQLLIDVRRVCGLAQRIGDFAYSHRPSVAFGLLLEVGAAHPRRLVEVWEWQRWTVPTRNASSHPPTEVDSWCMSRGRKWAALVHFGATLRVPVATMRQVREVEIKDYTRTSDGRLVDPYDAQPVIDTSKRQAPVRIS